jgi:hypothetical protein
MTKTSSDVELLMMTEGQLQRGAGEVTETNSDMEQAR